MVAALVVVVALAGGAFFVRNGRLPELPGAALTVGAPVPRPPLLLPVAGDEPRNVILIVGDGMGFSQLAAARFALRGPEGILWMQTLPSAAIVRTQSASSLVTDSAAAATAMATGVRVANGAISVDASGRPLRTLFESARARGLATGLVTTADITDATPAAFSAHRALRRDKMEIALQQSTSGVDVLLGCGTDQFLPPSRGGKRPDGADLVEAMRSTGYAITLDPTALVPSPSGKLLGLFAEKNRPSLASMARAAIETLSADPDGFIVMIESEETDSASHRHELDRLLRGMEDLDEAVRIALEFAKADGRTLVVVTSDHDTGGMQLVETKDAGTLGVHWTNGRHTAGPVPLFAWGPGASRFSGEIDNTAVHDFLFEALRLDATPQVGR